MSAVNVLLTIKKRTQCLLRSLNSRRIGVTWDGHCWDISGDEIRCTECGVADKRPTQ